MESWIRWNLYYHRSIQMAFSMTQKELRAFDLGRASINGAGHGLISGLEYEVCKDLAASTGAQFTPHRFPVPWQVLSRDMTAAGVSGSSYIVGTSNMDALQALRPWSVVMQSGCTVMPDQIDNVTIPRTITEATGYWLADENDPATESQPELGQISMMPKTCAGIVTFSHQMNLQSNIDGFLRAHLMQTIGRTLDRAALNGSGTSGQPTGIINVPGVYTHSGTGLAQSGIQTMLQNVSEAGAQDDQLAFIGTPAVRALLAQRPMYESNLTPSPRDVWDGRSVAGFPAHATADAPTASLFLGAWQELVIAIWGAPEISINPSTYFSTGKLQMRVMLHADVAVRHPAAFAVATSIT